jgi:sulfide:quinone oxidoreductase
MAGTVVLGGGFGGIAVATELRRLLGGAHEIVLVDRREHFTMGLRKLWDAFGIGSLEEGRRSRKRLADSGIRFVKQEIRLIDAETRRVVLDRETLDADHVVVALGAAPRPDLVPGLAEHAHNIWSEAGVPGLRGALERFGGGRILILVAGVPYTCPPAPFECAMLLDEHLRKRGLRDRTEITVATVQPILLPNAGREGSAWLGEQLTARGIAFRTGCKLTGITAASVTLEDGELPCDVLIGVPPHRPPTIVRDSGLGAEGGWIAVDPGTLATGWPGVFAIGDVTRIPLANGLPFPKAGAVAELEALRVAAAIAAEVRGETPPAAFDGRGFCFLETGATEAARIDGEFFATPQPRVSIGDVSKRHADDKRLFESERLARWFGS